MHHQQEFSIKEYSPLLVCLGDPAKFRVVARLNEPPGEILGTMDHMFDKATYSRKMDALLIKKESTLVTVYGSGIVTMTRLQSNQHGKELLDDVVGKINTASTVDNRDPSPDCSSARRIDPMEINGALPRSNCGKCGFKSCFYFATMLAFSEVGLEKCTPLGDPQYADHNETLSRIISRE